MSRRETNGIDLNGQNEAEPDLTLEQAIEEYAHEYQNINNTLDQLDSCLDSIEQQNDQLNVKMLELLQSNRQLRQELQTEIVAKQQTETDMEADSTEQDCSVAIDQNAGDANKQVDSSEKTEET
ncbi:UPF0184 protein-like [Lingula anatina]|uniref:UPF0184 protein-like n=1 Tax=Lingula anatina TaxID=7574 RepID=A0A1S3H526_LINAN|nr:UPF0184 protein-like [Lingula anatina]|eukprot:XP_013380239.1 UPF0184 protein-like [Lingula anatina]